MFMNAPHNAPPGPIRPSQLVLADGTVFEGEAIGQRSEVATGEVVFNTVMAGYQEVLTDPSYAGQIITFTYPHIGNYGTTAADDEGSSTFCRGVVIRDLARRKSSWRSDDRLDNFLRYHRLAGIAGVDTRRLTRHIRDSGAMPGAFGTAGEMAAAPFESPITNYYMTDPISRASETMAACTAEILGIQEGTGTHG